MSYRVEPLAAHDLEPFDCGNAELDDWLRRHVRTATGPFYEHHDFQPLPGHQRRLVMKLSTAAKALGVAWP